MDSSHVCQTLPSSTQTGCEELSAAASWVHTSQTGTEQRLHVEPEREGGRPSWEDISRVWKPRGQGDPLQELPAPGGAQGSVAPTRS